MQQIITLNIPLWLALIVMVLISLVISGAFYLGTTSEEREKAKINKRVEKAYEARQPRVLR